MDGQPPASELRWHATNAPKASSRTDDIWFADADRGWAVNSNGHILHTTDGGATWKRQFSASGAYLRCVGFAGDKIGWVGLLTEDRRLLHTTDGGKTWAAVEGLPPEAPPAVCGLSVVSDRVVFAAGSNFTDRPTGVMKTLDGGATWTATAMGEHATMLIDILFLDERRGWVVGGKADVPNPEREDCVPVVLATEDGGATWENRLAPLKDQLAPGEWGWKIQLLDDGVGFVSLENYGDAAILKTVDGGRTWERKVVNDPQDNANIEGVGFVDGQLGWVGGWGDENFQAGFTSETRDGGETWVDADHVGKFLNRFRFIRAPELVGYASGDTVYKYAVAPPPPPAETETSLAGGEPEADLLRTTLPVRLPVPAAADADVVRVDVFDRFGEHLATPLHQRGGSPEPREVAWTGETASGRSAGPGIYLVRVTIDEDAESRAVVVS